MIGSVFKAPLTGLSAVVIAKKDFWDVVGGFFDFDFELAGQITSVPAFVFALALALLAIVLFGFVVWKGGVSILAEFIDNKKMQRHKYREGDWKKYVAAIVFVIVLTSGGVAMFKSATDTLEDTVVDPAQKILEESQDDSSDDDDDEEDEDNN